MHPKPNLCLQHRALGSEFRRLNHFGLQVPFLQQYQVHQQIYGSYFLFRLGGRIVCVFNACYSYSGLWLPSSSTRNYSALSRYLCCVPASGPPLYTCELSPLTLQTAAHLLRQLITILIQSPNMTKCLAFFPFQKVLYRGHTLLSVCLQNHFLLPGKGFCNSFINPLLSAKCYKRQAKSLHLYCILIVGRK